MHLNSEMKTKIREAYFSGQLEVKSVSPEGDVAWKAITNVMRHNSSQKGIFEVVLQQGRCVVTGDHSLFTASENGVTPIRTEDIREGTELVVVADNTWTNSQVTALNKLPDRNWMYDIAVPGNESFVLSESGILAHNSYSIGGVSLDIDKSSKYQGIMSDMQSRLETMVENAHMTIKVTRGLQQPRFGVGVRSAFGPHVGSGISTPGNFTRF